MEVFMSYIARPNMSNVIVLYSIFYISVNLLAMFRTELSTNIYDIDNPRNIAPQLVLPAYPEPEISSKQGIFHNGKFILCGGRTSNKELVKTCYSAAPGDTNWTRLPDMLTGQGGMRGMMLALPDGSIWICGGLQGE